MSLHQPNVEAWSKRDDDLKVKFGRLDTSDVPLDYHDLNTAWEPYRQRALERLWKEVDHSHRTATREQTKYLLRAWGVAVLAPVSVMFHALALAYHGSTWEAGLLLSSATVLLLLGIYVLFLAETPTKRWLAWRIVNIRLRREAIWVILRLGRYSTQMGLESLRASVEEHLSRELRIEELVSHAEKEPVAQIHSEQQQAEALLSGLDQASLVLTAGEMEEVMLIYLFGRIRNQGYWYAKSTSLLETKHKHLFSIMGATFLLSFMLASIDAFLSLSHAMQSQHEPSMLAALLPVGVFILVAFGLASSGVSALYSFRQLSQLYGGYFHLLRNTDTELKKMIRDFRAASIDRDKIRIFNEFRKRAVLVEIKLIDELLAWFSIQTRDKYDLGA